MEPPFPAIDLITNEKRIVGYALHAERDEDVILPLSQLVRLASHGKLKPLIDGFYQIEGHEQAYKRLVSRQAVGSIVLQL